MIRLCLAAALSLLILSAQTANAEPWTTPSKLDPRFNDVHFDQRLGEILPLSTIVTDENGNTGPLSSFFNQRPVIFALAYYNCPNLCTLVLNGVAESVKPFVAGLGKSFDILTLSIDPEEKSPLALAKRRAYLARLGKTEGAWHFLTADEKNIKAIATAAGFFYRRDEISKEFFHPSGELIISPQGKISQYFFGIKFDSKKVQAALQAAKNEKQGSIIDRVLLYCFHYEPSMSRNGPLIIKGIRVLGLISAGSLAVLLIWLFRYKPKESFT
jgi:protein SCO1/2